MKILYITPGCFDKGGISRYNRYQIQALRELFGEENIKVISLLGPDANSFEDQFDTYWHGNGTSKKDKISMVWQAFKLALKWKPGIIFLGHVNLSGMGWLISKISGSKTILNVYGLEIWSKMSADASMGLKNVGLIISDCRNTADYLVKNNLRKENSITVVWDCIDTNKFKPGTNFQSDFLLKYNIPDPSKHFIILTLGRLSKPDAFYKGYDRLIKVFSKLSPNYPNARLVIAGRGNYKEDLLKLIAELRLEDKVSFTNSIDEADLATVYQTCSIFSLITEAGKDKGEGIPLTPLEAMACGKPILVGNQDGSREAIFEEQNGYSMDPGNLELHQKIIESYINDQELLRQHSANALSIAKEYFSYPIFKSKHEIFFKSLENLS
ncbi:MAG: hypothetical protein C5B52_09570 [Bacteroidetes bacterium]|nr:MAG: hypothetical protein C5B52_09570 [Bacteroidota bacterium]